MYQFTHLRTTFHVTDSCDLCIATLINQSSTLTLLRVIAVFIFERKGSIFEIEIETTSTACGIRDNYSDYQESLPNITMFEWQRDTQDAPKPRNEEAPPLDSIHKLATGALHDVILAFHDNNLCPESCQLLSHKCREFEEV